MEAPTLHPRLLDLLPLLLQAQARFASARSRYAGLRARAQAESIDEQWFAGAHHAPVPLALQRLGLQPAPRLPRPPSGVARANTCRYGLHRDGRVCVEQQFTEFPDRAYEEFWEYADDRILTTRYDHYEPDKDPINTQIVLLERSGERPRAAALVRYAQKGVALEAYEYDPASAHLPRRVHTAAHEHDPASPQHGWMTTTDDIGLDASGRLIRIVRTWAGGISETIYPDPDDGGAPA